MVEIAKMEAKGETEGLVEKKKLLEQVEDLHELNPMLGHRGCRLGITYPEITEMQTRAIIEAAADLIQQGKKIVPEIMVPLVGNVLEFRNQKNIIDGVAKKVIAEKSVKMTYLVGTMIDTKGGFNS